MKHNFLLDENILYFAVKGTDEHDNPDDTAAQLVRLIAQNCHTIVMNPELVGKYEYHLRKLENVPVPAIEPAFFLSQLIKNSAKTRMEYADPPELPAGSKIPRKDIHVVRAALLSRPLVVTADGPLRNAINAQPSLGFRALTPAQAIVLAKEK